MFVFLPFRLFLVRPMDRQHLGTQMGCALAYANRELKRLRCPSKTWSDVEHPYDFPSIFSFCSIIHVPFGKM